MGFLYLWYSVFISPQHGVCLRTDLIAKRGAFLFFYPVYYISMNVASSTSLINTFVSDTGVGVLAVLTTTLGLAVAYMVFKFGWDKLLLSMSEGGILDRSQRAHDLAMEYRIKRGDFKDLEDL